MQRRLFLQLGAFGKAGPPKAFLTQLPAWMEVAPVPGVWVTWIERGKVAWEQGFGVRSVATRQRVDAQTIFEAASLTKQVTAYIAHALRSEGKLDFDKPLNEYVEGAAPTVTPRHVLSHSSGFPNWRREKGPLVSAFAPGEQFRYSGEGYVYLSRVMEKVADRAIGELAQERVFGPLGMTNSSFARLPEREAQMAVGHDNRGAVRERRSAVDPRVLSRRYAELEALTPLPNNMTPNAAASMCTTGPDYARFVLRAIKNPELRKMQVRMGEGAGWKLGWGLGWGIEQVAGRQWLWQWGDNGGYKNFVMVDPVAETGVFVFTNGDAGMRICDRVVTHSTGAEHPAFLWL